MPGLAGGLTPRQFMGRHLEPRLQFRDDERDLVVMINVFEGLSGGRRKRLTSTLTLRRDLETGLLGMGLGVGYPASIVAQMLAGGRIVRRACCRRPSTFRTEPLSPSWRAGSRASWRRRRGWRDVAQSLRAPRPSGLLGSAEHALTRPGTP